VLIVFDGSARVPARVRVAAACIECGANPLVRRDALGLLGQQLDDTTANSFGEGDSAAVGPELELAILGLGELYLCTHHDVIILLSLLPVNQLST
jgi:hypothetical protein